MKDLALTGRHSERRSLSAHTGKGALDAQTKTGRENRIENSERTCRTEPRRAVNNSPGALELRLILCVDCKLEGPGNWNHNEQGADRKQRAREPVEKI
jgi:hypothetical protein